MVCYDITGECNITAEACDIIRCAKYDVACTSSGVARKAEAGSLEIQRRQVFAIHFPEMADVSLCLKYCIPMSAYSTVNIV